MPKPQCVRCGAGSTISFNWDYALEVARSGKTFRDITVFAETQALRQGTLYRCTICGQPWYRSGGRPQQMHAVAPDRALLIQRWNEKPIPLRADLRSRLASIGRTPPDLYGNGSEFQETPCSVKTVDGGRIETAVVSLQRHAPFEDWREVRLASEIAEIDPSPFALSLEVRIGCSQAEEVAMGYSPTLVAAPDGDLVVLNGTRHFLSRNKWKGPDFKLSRKPYPDKPQIGGDALKIVYFVADPDKDGN